MPEAHKCEGEDAQVVVPVEVGGVGVCDGVVLKDAVRVVVWDAVRVVVWDRVIDVV